MKRFILAALALPMALAFLFITGEARAQSGAPARIGILRCQVDGGVGQILGSRRELSCIFESIDGRPAERYAGEINRIGIDIGSTSYSDIAWAVFAVASTPYGPGALQGTYVGVSGSASVGYGLGANVLVGGLEQSFALQPVSVEASSGFNLALGVAQLNLISVDSFGTGD